MRQLVQGNKTATTPTTTANAKFIVIRGKKAESVYFPAHLTHVEVAAILLARQDITPEDRVVRG